MDNKRSKFLWILVILVIFVVVVSSAAWFLAIGLKEQVKNTLSPLQQTNNALSTQIANLLHPTPTVIPDPVTIIRQIQSLARLETIQYSIEKVITAEVNQGAFGPLFGDKLLLVAHGTVIAGVDLQKMDELDLALNGDVLEVHLPETEVFSASLNNEQSYIYDRTTGLLTKGNPQLETTARQAAEKEILSAAIEDGILDLAQQNAEVYLERLFNTLGYLKVVFVK